MNVGIVGIFLVLSLSLGPHNSAKNPHNATTTSSQRHGLTTSAVGQ